LTTTLTATAQTTCPPTNFDSLSDFDFDGFIEDRWYSILQLSVVYQPLNQFHCVYAEYTKVVKKSWFCQIFRCEDPPTIKVFNSARRGSTSGRVSSINFEGTVTDADQSTSKAKVSFPLVPRPLRRGSNYWVVAAGKFNDLPSVTNYTASDLTYDYAIITSGEPDTAGMLSFAQSSELVASTTSKNHYTCDLNINVKLYRVIGSMSIVQK
jgi:hypothetical protein